MNIIRNPLPPLAALTTLLPCLLLGNFAFVTWLGAHAAWLVLPTSLGAPLAFPRLRFTTFVGQTGGSVAVELLAVLVLVTAVAWWVHRATRVRPAAGSWRMFLSTWAGVVSGLAAANALRAGVAGLALGTGPWTFLVYVLVGAASGALWAVVSGWLCAVPVGVAHRLRSVRHPRVVPVS